MSRFATAYWSDKNVCAISNPLFIGNLVGNPIRFNVLILSTLFFCVFISGWSANGFLPRLIQFPKDIRPLLLRQVPSPQLVLVCKMIKISNDSKDLNSIIIHFATQMQHICNVDNRKRVCYDIIAKKLARASFFCYTDK